jgi:hypothetical protein
MIVSGGRGMPLLDHLNDWAAELGARNYHTATSIHYRFAD